MNDLVFSFTNNSFGGVAIGWWALLIFAVWLSALVSLLRRRDLEPADRIVWTIVVCTTNVLGALLYWFLAPGKPGSPSRPRTDAELKDYFNKQGP